MAHDRTRLQRKSAEPAASSAGANMSGPLAGSPALLAQRKQIQSAFGAAAQLASPEEELQKKAPEEELQKKAPDEELGK